MPGRLFRVKWAGERWEAQVLVLTQADPLVRPCACSDKLLYRWILPMTRHKLSASTGKG